MRTRYLAFAMLVAWLFSASAWAQPAMKPAAGQTLSPAAVSAAPDDLLNGAASAWSQISPKRVALNRTPPLFDTDEPATLEIPIVDVRLARSGGKLLVRLSWQDATTNSAKLAEVPTAAPETRFIKVPTEADDRFFDAAAVMFPQTPSPDASTPSLQMGDAEHPVDIYYWNAARGSLIMHGKGRGTTSRSGATFLARGTYQSGRWNLTMELPDLAAGTPIAFAVWNGSQTDRDGRKYFSVWQVVQ